MSRDIRGEIRCKQQLEKDSDVVIRLIHEQTSNSEGGDGLGWYIMVLQEMGKDLVEVAITGKRRLIYLVLVFAWLHFWQGLQ